MLPTKPHGMALNQKIAHALTATEIHDLLKLGTTFKDASPVTKRKWRRNAERRLKEIAEGR